MSQKLLLVEDDESLGRVLQEYLKMNDFKIDWAKNGPDGLRKIKNNSYDLCILDIMLPQKDGFTVAKEIKELEDKIPFVFLTAKSLKIDQLKGFDIGADDYIVKPIDEELFIARIKAILNRFESNGRTSSGYYNIGSYQFDPRMRELLNNEKKQVLSPRETDVLTLLCKNKGELIRRKDALKKIWGADNNQNRQIMDVYVSKLRNHLSGDSNVEIRNIHGTGFVLVENSLENDS